jgi:hypothetical protein
MQSTSANDRQLVKFFVAQNRRTTGEIILTRIATTTMPNSGARAAAAYLTTRGNKATVTADLNKIAKLIGARNWQEVNWETLNAGNILEVVDKFKTSPSTRKRILTVLKGVARSAWRMGNLDTEALVRIDDLKSDPEPEVESAD